MLGFVVLEVIGSVIELKIVLGSTPKRGECSVLWAVCSLHFDLLVLYGVYTLAPGCETVSFLQLLFPFDLWPKTLSQCFVTEKSTYC